MEQGKKPDCCIKPFVELKSKYIKQQHWKEHNREGLQELNRITEISGNFANEHRKF